MERREELKRRGERGRSFKVDIDLQNKQVSQASSSGDSQSAGPVKRNIATRQIKARTSNTSGNEYVQPSPQILGGKLKYIPQRNIDWVEVTQFAQKQFGNIKG